jgi:exo-1,4-beta-D-glucosaminidase
MTPKFNQEIAVNLDPDSSTQLLTLPKLGDLSSTYFVRLELHDASNKLLSTNFYWLSTTPETLDWSKTNYFVTPVVQHADLKALNTLPQVTLKGAAVAAKQGNDDVVHVTLANPSKALAFAVSLRLTDSKGNDVLPAVLDDNYFPLLPGEKRTVTVRYAAEDLGGSKPTIRVDGWNVSPVTLNTVAPGRNK